MEMRSGAAAAKCRVCGCWPLPIGHQMQAIGQLKLETQLDK